MRYLFLILFLLISVSSFAQGWEVVYEFPQWLTLLDIECSGEKDVWVVGINEQTNTNQIYYSADRGETFNLQYSGMDLSVFLYDIGAIDPLTAFISGQYNFFFPDTEGCGAKTYDGGISWGPIEAGFADFIANYLSVSVVSQNEVHLVGSWGFSSTNGLLSTYDSGASWQNIVIPSTHPVRYADFVGSNNIWVTGGAWPEDEENNTLLEHNPLESYTSESSRTGQFESSIWHSSDGGNSWELQMSNTDIGYMAGIDMVNSQLGIAVGSANLTSQIYRTTDGGQNWNRIHFPSENEHNLIKIVMTTDTEGWATGYNGNGPDNDIGGVIIHTTDAGLTWELYDLEPIACSMMGLSMMDQHWGFACGGNNMKFSTVLRYDDGYYSGTNVPNSIALDLKSSPNPFNPSTTISYNLESSEQVLLEVYNHAGQQIVQLENSHKDSGSHNITWNGTDSTGRKVSSGTYLVKLTAGKKTATQKISMIK